MDFENNYKTLLNQMNYNFDNKSLKHNINKNSPLIPFVSRNPERVTFNKGFNTILGEFCRILLNKEWDDNLDYSQITESIIDEDIEFDENTQETFKSLLVEYLFDEKDELKILDPYLFLYIPLSASKQSKGEKRIALFMRDVFFSNNTSLKNFFEKKESNHIIINLILNNIPDLDDKETAFTYFTYFDNIVELFNKDIEFAVSYENFFVENMHNIFAYYYFFYISQLILRISQGFKAKDDMENLFYLLDWETASKNRKSLNVGYAFLKDQSRDLFSKMTLIDQLNTLLGTHAYLEKDMLEYYNNLEHEDQTELLKYLKKWIIDYRDLIGFDDTDLPNTFDGLVTVLYESINDSSRAVDSATKSRYSKNIEEIAKKYLAKRRGSYGYVLNINKDMLLTITALCVRNEKIKLNQLFEEYEKRGIYFDRYSKLEVIDFLTKLNLIDKKSDSGDAQYVRPIL